MVVFDVYSTAVPKPAFACYQTTDTVWYFPDASPAVGDQVYTTSNASATPSFGNYGYASLSFTTNFKITVNSSGVITSVSSC
jgi:hypothetical protein